PEAKHLVATLNENKEITITEQVTV
ncbi:TPA: hypothetical protein ACSK2L_003011, partial [Listeria monocytogenes]